MQSSQLRKRLVAHRGHQTRFQENSLAAMESAVSLGVTRLEFDLQLTADQVPVLFHDLDMQRLCQQHQKITETPYAALRGLELNEAGRSGLKPEPILSLAEFVDWTLSRPHLHLYAEMKEESIEAFGAPAALDALLSAVEPVRSRLTLISFDIDLLEAAYYCGLATGLVARQWSPSKEVLMRCQPSVLFVNKRRVRQREHLNRYGIPVVVYEVDTLRRAAHWLKRGATYLETFSCEELLDDWRSQHG